MRGGLFLVSIGVALLSLELPNSYAQTLGYPSPRYPRIPEITTVEELMPNARHVVTRVGNGVMRPGFGIKGGEKVLLFFGGYAQSNTDPLVIEALARAIREKNGRVDILIVQSDQPDVSRMWDPEISSEITQGVATGSDLRDRSVYGSGGGPPWLNEVAKQYDLVGGLDELVNGRRNMWPTREALASPAISYPEEILSAIDQKGWELIIQANKVHLTDPQGTDVRFTYWPEYWQVVEGTHPTVNSKGGGPGTTRGEGYVYGHRGASEHALIPGHLMGYPEGIVLDKSDAEGVVVGTQSHRGFFPPLKLTLKGNKIVQMEGGGRYGELWRKYLETHKDVKYPLFPGAGVGYWMEAAIGTHPKIARPHNMMESVAARSLSSYERMRSGIIHMGFGSILSENSQWARQNNAPGGHFHIHLNFATFEIETREGKKLKLIDKGHLTVLDDPEVRRIAAKYGDPDELLKEDWIPAYPGINSPGNYEQDFAKDPVAWITQEHRKAYAYIIDFKPYP